MAATNFMENVTDAMQAVAKEVILPKFNKLSSAEIHKKAAGELVTDVDLAVEQALSERLTRLLPGSAVVGEEGVSMNPESLAGLGQASKTWVIDPVDGTYNFVHGKAEFAVIVALLDQGRTVAGWIHQPKTGLTLQAQKDHGASCNGQVLRIGDHIEHGWKGFAGKRIRKHIRSAVKKREGPSSLPTSELDVDTLRCAGLEYVSLARGEAHFSIYGSLKPWDHAAGVLIVEEAGGIGRHLDGKPYEPVVQSHTPLIVARNRTIWSQMSTILAPFY